MIKKFEYQSIKCVNLLWIQRKILEYIKNEKTNQSKSKFYFILFFIFFTIVTIIYFSFCKRLVLYPPYCLVHSFLFSFSFDTFLAKKKVSKEEKEKRKE